MEHERYDVLQVMFPAASTHKGANYRSKDVTQVQKQRPESPTVTLTWHACKCKAHKLHQRYILSIRKTSHKYNNKALINSFCFRFMSFNTSKLPQIQSLFICYACWTR